MAQEKDFILFDHGSVCILNPRSEAAVTWIEEHISDDALRWGRNGVVIERGYVLPILDGIAADGLTLDSD